MDATILVGKINEMTARLKKIVLERARLMDSPDITEIHFLEKEVDAVEALVEEIVSADPECILKALKVCGIDVLKEAIAVLQNRDRYRYSA